MCEVGETVIIKDTSRDYTRPAKPHIGRPGVVIGHLGNRFAIVEPLDEPGGAVYVPEPTAPARVSRKPNGGAPEKPARPSR